MQKSRKGSDHDTKLLVRGDPSRNQVVATVVHRFIVGEHPSHSSPRESAKVSNGLVFLSPTVTWAWSKRAAVARYGHGKYINAEVVVDHDP